MNSLCLKSCRITTLQPEVTEGGVVLHQNNTCPIMAGGCHVVMTENVVVKGDNMKSRCPRRCLTTPLCWGDVQDYFRPYSLFLSAFPARTGGFDSFTPSIPTRSADARDRMVATQQPGRATFVETRGFASGGSWQPYPADTSPELGCAAVKLDENTPVRARLRV